jgi:IclR family transcriptional regulator, KDG regulon repressor
LKQHLQTVRSQGYAIDNEENESGVRCVAAPIRNQSGRVIAAASLSGPSIRISKKRLREALRDEIIRTGEAISWRLGFRQ